MKPVDIIYRMIWDDVKEPRSEELLQRKRAAVSFISQQLRIYGGIHTIAEIVTRMHWHQNEFSEVGGPGLVLLDHLHRIDDAHGNTRSTAKVRIASNCRSYYNGSRNGP